MDAAAEWPPGRGRVDFFAFANPTRAGGGVDYSHRLSRNASAFAQGWAGAERDVTGWRTAYDALAGLRLRW